MSDEGAKVFAKLDEDDKRALKRFMTGQIQNVLANEYGIGGTKVLKEQMRQAIREEAERVARQMIGDNFAVNLAERLLRIYRGEKTTREVLMKAIQDAAQVEMARVVRQHTDRINITLGISPLPGEPGFDNPHFGEF